MKRFLALLLLLTLLPLVPALGEEEIDVPAVILEDTWVNDDFTMTFSADGTGVMTYHDATHEGTWEYVNKMVYFHYQQLGDLTVKLSMTKRDGEYILSSNFFTLQKKAVREQKEQESKETAEKNLKVLEWGEEVALDFMSFSLDDVKVYRSLYQLIDDYQWQFPITKGKKYLVVYGTVKNPDDNERWLGGIRAEVVLDEKDTYKMDVYTVPKGETYYTTGLLKKATQKLFFAAEIPEDVAGSFATAELRFSLYNFLAGTPTKDFEGDFFFRLSIDEAKAKSARKAPARKKTYYTAGKNKSIPKPSSYTDVIEESSGSYTRMHPTSGKGVDVKGYYFRSQFDGETPEEVVKTYVKGLKSEDLTVSKVDGKKSKYGTEMYTFYTINKGKTALGWIELYGNNSYSAEVYIIEK